MAGARRFPRSLILGALLLALLAGGFYSFVSMSIANRWLRHTDEVRVKIALLRATLLDAETGLRGYLLTGTPAFLAPYERAHATWRPQLDDVQRLTSDHAEQQGRLRALERVIADHFAGFTAERAAAERERAKREPLPMLLEHKRTMDAARLLLGDMEREEAVLDRLRHRDANRRWGLTVAFFIAGMVAFLSVAVVFARQRRLSETRRLHAEEEQRLLQAVFAGIDDGITLQDRSGKLIFANAAAARMIGFPTAAALLAASTQEILARFELLDEDGRPFPPDRLPARAVLAGGVAQKTRIRYRAGPSGPWRWSLIDAHPITDANGKVVQAINVFRDVTAERDADGRRRFLLRAVDELTSSLNYEATLAAVARLAVPSLADWCAVDIVDGDQVKRLAVAHVDPAKVSLVAEVTRRYPPDPASRAGVHEIIRTGKAQLLSRIPRELLTAAAHDEEHLRLIESLDLRSFVGVPLSAGGKVLGAISFVMAESHRVYDESDMEFARALADRAALAIENARLFSEVERARAATAARLIDEERRRRDAEDQARFAETFVGMLGHDLRNPLNAIVMTTRLLRRLASAPNEVNAVDRIQSSALRMSNMVGQLLDLTRSRLAGGIPIEKGPLDLAGVVSEAIDEMRRAYPARQIAWAGSPGVRADADRDRLAQVLSNLIGNALEHGDPDRPVTVQLSSSAGRITLAVHNDGPPIADGLLPSLFEPFRHTVVRNERSKGLGLGLYITQQIVRAHGGQLEVSSTAQSGTTFTVVLPRPDGDLVDSTQQRLVS